MAMKLRNKKVKCTNFFSIFFFRLVVVRLYEHPTSIMLLTMGPLGNFCFFVIVCNNSIETYVKLNTLPTT